MSMYSNKTNILQLVALLKAHNIRKIVLCPGSRNAPIVQTIAANPFFNCTSVADERSAAYVALGLALKGGEPAAVCCTSGTALLNMHPAVAEAYYQQVPLVVISADRPASWIGQMDGQTLPQPGVFGSLVKSSVNLPEVKSEEDEWYCNRLVNEALLELFHRGRGPVHINVPLSEPLFDFTETKLPEVRVITRYEGLNVYHRPYDDLIERLNKYDKRMMLAGQLMMVYLFDKRINRSLYQNFVWLSEHLANRTSPAQPIRNFDAIISSFNEKECVRYQPELLITYGGHIVSKEAKNYLRKYPPKEHWHVTPNGEIADTFGCLTTVIEMSPFEFLETIAPLLDNRKVDFPALWEGKSKRIPTPPLDYSSVGVVGQFFKDMPQESVLHLANSSVVRYAQLFTLPEEVEVLCNRGTNGIEGSLSTAVGYAMVSSKLNFVLIGDLSFFYDMNALWGANYGSNIRVLLLNNSGGEIFKLLPMGLSQESERFVLATHQTKAKAWVTDCGFDYLPVTSQAELDEALPKFVDPEINQTRPLFMEVFTDSEVDIEKLKGYFKSIKS